MHELSLVMNILRMAETEAARHGSRQVETVQLEIGELSGVEMAAFRFAWQQAVPGTVLEGAALRVQRTAGTGCCRLCGTHFPVSNLYTACPQCGSYAVSAEAGKAFRVQSLVLVT